VKAAILQADEPRTRNGERSMTSESVLGTKILPTYLSADRGSHDILWTQTDVVACSRPLCRRKPHRTGSVTTARNTAGTRHISTRYRCFARVVGMLRDLFPGNPLGEPWQGVEELHDMAPWKHRRAPENAVLVSLHLRQRTE
jgi:hypothetical protein